MAYRLEKQEPIGVGLRRIAVECADAIAQQVTDETVDRDKAVHNARKSCKRLRATLRLLRDGVGTAVFRRENIGIRDVSRLLGTARDSYVLLETLTALEQQYPDALPAPLVADAHMYLVQRYEQVLQQLLTQDSAIDEVLQRVRAARKRLAKLPVDKMKFTVAARSLRRVYRCGRRAFVAAYAAESGAHAFHEWRKWVKYLWYEIEIMQDLWPALLLPLADELHTLSGYLGDDHDLVELRQVALHDPSMASVADVPLLLDLIARRRAELQTAAHPLGQRIFAERPRIFVQRLATYWQAWQMDAELTLQTVSDSRVVETAVTPWQERLFTTGQAAAFANLSVAQVRSLIDEGKLAAFKLGGSWVIEKEALAQWMGDGGR